MFDEKTIKMVEDEGPESIRSYYSVWDGDDDKVYRVYGYYDDGAPIITSIIDDDSGQESISNKDLESKVYQYLEGCEWNNLSAFPEDMDMYAYGGVKC